MNEKLVKTIHYAGKMQKAHQDIKKIKGTVKKVQKAVEKHPAEYKKLGELLWQRSKHLLQSVRKRN